MKYPDKYDLWEQKEKGKTKMTCAKMAIPTPPLGDLTYKSRKIKWSLPDLLEAWNMAIEQVRPAPRKKGKVHFS